MEFRKLSKGRKKDIHSLLSIPKHYTLGRVVNVGFKYLETQGMLNTDRSWQWSTKTSNMVPLRTRGK